MTDTVLLAELERDEGIRLKPYTDSTGHLTLGVGRNLTDVGIFPDEARYMLLNDVLRARDDLDAAIPWWRTLSPVRQRVMINMTFNLGMPTLLTFHDTLHAIEVGNYVGAANGMMNSKWATQVGPRASRLARMMVRGEDFTS